MSGRKNESSLVVGETSSRSSGVNGERSGWEGNEEKQEEEKVA